MKRFIAMLLILLATTAVAQEKKSEEKKEDYTVTRDFRNKVFEVQNREVRELLQSIHLLGSGFKGAGMNVNEELRTITVRDFPENIAAIEEALKRLDRPAKPTPDIELKIAVLIASKSPLPGASIPDDLQPVVKQLQSTLRYTHYGLMTAIVQRTKPGVGIEGSGVAESLLLGLPKNDEKPIFYNYRFRQISLGGSNERPTIEVGNHKFGMQVPVNVGTPASAYQHVGFETPVSIRQNEKVVIGTTTMGDKALIVVVTASM